MAMFAHLWLLLFVCLGHDIINVRATESLRPGEATETHSCNRVRRVPRKLFRPDVMRPDGVDPTFYKKYTEAYGIPILGSSKVSNDALKRACYTVRFLFAGHSGIRATFYKFGGRFAVMSATEVTLDIPEHSGKDPWWNKRARGLGGSFTVPIVTGAEENLLCWPNDNYHRQDIFLHETGHAIDNVCAKVVIPGYLAAKKDAYDYAKRTGLWNNTYSIRNSGEYFAEAAQIYFNVKAEGKQGGGGTQNDINTREELRTYDPTLYNLVRQMFPCNNTYLKRCESTRELEQNQVLRMNCNTENLDFPKRLVDPNCPDLEPIKCITWWLNGECERNAGFMRNNCKASCGFCSQ